MPAVVYTLTLDEPPQALYISPRCEEVLGFPPEAWMEDITIGIQRVQPGDAARTYSRWRDVIDSGLPFSGECRYLHPDGRTRWLLDRAQAIPAERGSPLIVQGSIQDITAWHRAEQELKGSEARYRALVENIPAVIYEMGPDDERRTTYVSPHVEKVLGYTRAEWLEQNDIWTELLHPDDREIELAAHDLHNESGEPWHRRYRLIAADGRIVWVRDHAVLVRTNEHEPARWLGVMLDVTAQKEAEDQLRQAHDQLEFRVAARTIALHDANELMGIEIAERRRVEMEASRVEERLRARLCDEGLASELDEDYELSLYEGTLLDISDRKQAEERLRASEATFRSLIEGMPAIPWTKTFDPATGRTTYTYIGPQAEAIVGYTPEELMSEPGHFERLLHPDDRERVLAAAAESNETGRPWDSEYRVVARDGTIVRMRSRAVLETAEGDRQIWHGIAIVQPGSGDVDAAARDDARIEEGV